MASRHFGMGLASAFEDVPVEHIELDKDVPWFSTSMVVEGQRSVTVTCLAELKLLAMVFVTRKHAHRNGNQHWQPFVSVHRGSLQRGPQQ